MDAVRECKYDARWMCIFKGVDSGEDSPPTLYNIKWIRKGERE